MAKKKPLSDREVYEQITSGEAREKKESLGSLSTWRVTDVVPAQGLIAKKDFHLVHNDVDIKIKAGDDLSKVPAQFLENLKTEQVI